jgi:hypothetical protein
VLEDRCVLRMPKEYPIQNAVKRKFNFGEYPFHALE